MVNRKVAGVDELVENFADYLSTKEMNPPDDDVQKGICKKKSISGFPPIREKK